MDSRIVTTETGGRYLEVRYTRNDWNEAIRQALNEHGLEHGDMAVIALPECLRSTF